MTEKNNSWREGEVDSFAGTSCQLIVTLMAKPLIAQEKVAFLKKEQTAKLRGNLWPFDLKRAKETKQLYMGKE